MTKLWKLKSWLTLDEAARQVSSLLSEPVTVADLYQLALERKLQLSVHFVNHARACYGKRLSVDEATLRIMPKDPIKPPPGDLVSTFPKDSRAEQNRWLKVNAHVLNDERYVIFLPGVLIGNEGAREVLNFERDVVSLLGVWDLSMFGAESLDVEHRLQQEIGGPDVTLVDIDGAIVMDGEGRYARLMEHMSSNEYVKDRADRERYPYSDANSYYPASGIPADAQIVVRPAALADFLATVGDSDKRGGGTDLRTDAKATYARVIGALWAKAHGAGGKGTLSNVPNTAAQSIANKLSEWGIEKPGVDKIASILSEEVIAAGMKIGSSDPKG